MPIKKYYATKDTTITDAYDSFGVSRMTDANTGASDSLEIFSISGSVASNVIEKSRILISFDNDTILSDRTNIREDGNISYYLKLYNIKHPHSIPSNFTIAVQMVNGVWDEGGGLDMETYLDKGWPLGSGATWKYRTKTDEWTAEGADVVPDFCKTQTFEVGTEDLEVDITDWVVNNNLTASSGFLIRLSGSYENGSNNQSYFTKKFSSRGTEYFYNKPTVEARWEPIIKDDRSNFYSYSPFVDIEYNTMKLYYYNKVNGKTIDVPNSPSIDVKFYIDKLLTNEITPNSLSVTKVATGVYCAEVVLETTESLIYDQWSFDIYTTPITSFPVYMRENNTEFEEYKITLKNLKGTYRDTETVRLNLNIKEKNFPLNIYSKVFEQQQNSIINNLFYKISRPYDNYVILDYSTGSIPYTQTSYDSGGNYIELDMKLFEKNYSYNIQFATWDGQNLSEFPETFKFRVE